MNKDYELVQIDLEMVDLITNEDLKSLKEINNTFIGGAKGDSIHILRYINNKKNKLAKSIKSSNGKKYIFKLIDKKKSKKI